MSAPTVAFHVNVPDKISYACRLLRKAAQQQVRVLVQAPADVLAQLDTVLWTFAPLEFVAHCRVNSPPHVRAATPIVLAEDAQDSAGCPVWLNLGGAIAPDLTRFERVIEIVDAQDRPQARLRWRDYVAQGCTMTQHDFQKPSP